MTRPAISFPTCPLDEENLWIAILNPALCEEIAQAERVAFLAILAVPAIPR